MTDIGRYKISAVPHLEKVSPGAEMTFFFGDTRAHATYSAPGHASERIRWYRNFSREGAKDNEEPQFNKGPYGAVWEKVLLDRLGKHVINTYVKFPDGAEGDYDYRVWVEPAEGFLARAIIESRKRKLPDPTVTLGITLDYIRLLKQIERAYPINDADKKKKHDETLKAYGARFDALADRLDSTGGMRRIPIHAIHLEKASQKQTRLSVFVAATGWADGLSKQVWRLVDWTNPLDKAQTADIEAEGANPEEAIRNLMKSWESKNRHYPGTIKWEVPKAATGKAFGGSFETTGETRWDRFSKYLDWVATGAAVLAGIVALVAPIPGSCVISAAIWTSILSSTAGSIINMKQNLDEGSRDTGAYIMDSLTIASNLFAGVGKVAKGAGEVWKRGATIKVLNREKRVVEGVLICHIGQLSSDGIQGILLGLNHLEEYNKIMSDASLSPEERAQKLLDLFKKALLKQGLNAFSIRGTKKDIQNLHKAPKYIKGSEEVKTPAQKLEELKDPSAKIDATKNPVVEGHTSHGSQKTTVSHRYRRAYKKIQSKKGKYGPTPPPRERGIRSTHDFALSVAAEQEKLIIIARCGNIDAPKYVGKPGYKPKPEDLKSKSRLTGEHKGLAAADPNDSRLQKMLETWEDPQTGKTKKIEYSEYVDYLKEKGYTVGGEPEYLISNTKTGDKYYSDIDLHGVYKENGAKAYSEGLRQRLNADMGADMIQHAPHDDWSLRESRKAGPNRGPQPPCTAYLPDGTTVYLKDIDDMKAFYPEHNIKWQDIYTGKYTD